MGDTKIEWTNKTWNPVRGCSVVSEGCRNCYAMNFAARFAKEGEAYEGLAYRNGSGAHWTGKVRLIEEHLNDPLKWRKPARIFVNSMSDLFHESLTYEQIDRVFAVMIRADNHVFQVLTKRPQRMRDYFAADAAWRIWKNLRDDDIGAPGLASDVWGWLKHVWLGVSVEDQKTADERIPLLLQTPATVRWISAEPLLGPLDLTRVDYSNLLRETLKESVRYSAARRGEDVEAAVAHAAASIPDPSTLKPGERPYLNVLNGTWFDGWDSGVDGKRIDWVVCGGESGPKARPMHPHWARSLCDQCTFAGVPFFFKQWGEWAPLDVAGHHDSEEWKPITARDAVDRIHKWDDEDLSFRIGKKAAGRLLDGVEWSQFPEARTKVATA